MGWTYRVVKFSTGCGDHLEEGFEIRDVYENGDENLWSEDTATAYGNSVEELKQDLIDMLQAFDKPVMEEIIEQE